jgi:hypothetical protein
MGNWDRSRRFLTARERGILRAILLKLVTDAGSEIVRERRCIFSLTSRFPLLLPERTYVFNTNWITAVDDYVKQSSVVV